MPKYLKATFTSITLAKLNVINPKLIKATK